MNKIILFIFFVIIIYIFFHNSKDNDYSNKIAVVGNGPLTEKEIKKINNYEIIAVINDSRNSIKKNIKLNPTMLFLRQIQINCDGFFGYDFNKNEFKNPDIMNTIKDIIFISPEKKVCMKNINKIKKKYPKFNYKIISSGDEPWEKKPYKFNGKIYNLDKLPSSGITTIKYMLENYPKSEVHIYGMNWNAKSHTHNFKKEKEYINESKKCIIHKTWKNTYEPFKNK